MKTINNILAVGETIYNLYGNTAFQTPFAQRDKTLTELETFGKKYNFAVISVFGNDSKITFVTNLPYTTFKEIINN